MPTFTRNILISTVGMVILYAFLFKYIDRALANYMVSLTNAKLTKISFYLSLLGAPKLWLAISLLGFAVFALLNEKNGLAIHKLSILYFSSAIFGAELLGTIIKIGLGRARPILFFQHNIYGLHFFSLLRDYNSTPSGHALCIFTVAAMASCFYRRFTGIFMFIALVIGLSRVILAEHFLSDVIAGAYLGMLSVYLANKIASTFPAFTKTLDKPQPSDTLRLE